MFDKLEFIPEEPAEPDELEALAEAKADTSPTVPMMQLIGNYAGRPLLRCRGFSDQEEKNDENNL